jgi:hypothetical protein
MTNEKLLSSMLGNVTTVKIRSTESNSAYSARSEPNDIKKKLVSVL